jgi:hypothetical protein
MVMVSNHTSMEFGYMAGRHVGRLGHLYSPGGQRGPFPFLPYALDNGAYGCWQRNVEFDPAPWMKLLDWAARSGTQPVWAAVPDVMMLRDRTIESWHQYRGEVVARGFRPAFVCQDGMTFDDVPDDECMLFIGGSTQFKLAAVQPWCARFPGRVHVGRVSGPDRLAMCERAGAVSVDGSGWFHRKQRAQLRSFLEATT